MKFMHTLTRWEQKLEKKPPPQQVGTVFFVFLTSLIIGIFMGKKMGTISTQTFDKQRSMETSRMDQLVEKIKVKYYPK